MQKDPHEGPPVDRYTHSNQFLFQAAGCVGSGGISYLGNYGEMS